jgi:hypothetical protein
VPQQELDLLEIPAVFRHSLAQERRRSWAPKRSIPICCDDCSTTDQTAQSLSVSRFTFPLFETERSSRPLSIPAAVVQTSMPCFTRSGWRRFGCTGLCPRGRPAPICRPFAGWSQRRARPTRSAGGRRPTRSARIT